MFETDCVVVGAGAVGLAIARRLALDGRDVVVLERAASVGTETSSRSNEVIHAGIYHRPGGPQAVLCGRGREMLYEYCESHGLGHRQIGKLIVATDDESVGWLEETHQRARANDVPQLAMLTRDAAARLEPLLHCHAALLSQRTGIVDTHGLLLAYRGDAEAAGAAVVCNTRFVAACRVAGGFDVEISDTSGEHAQVRCTWLINAAGISAPEVSRAIDGMNQQFIPKIYLAKGGFFGLRGASPFSRLIVPEPRTWRQGGICTLDLAGRARFGPDEIWVDEVDYDLEGHSFAHVYHAVRRYFPALPDGALSPDYAGIRPRLNGPGDPPADWLFQSEVDHGLAGLVNLFGIESPGITASLPIADAVADLLAGRGLPFEVSHTHYGRWRPPPAVGRVASSC